MDSPFFLSFFASFSAPAQIGRIAKCGHTGFVFYTYLFSSIIQYTNFHQIRNGTSKPNNNRSKQSLKKSKYRKIMSTVLLWSLHNKLFFFFFFLMRCFLNSYSLYDFVIVTLSHFFFSLSFGTCENSCIIIFFSTKDSVNFSIFIFSPSPKQTLAH